MTVADILDLMQQPPIDWLPIWGDAFVTKAMTIGQSYQEELKDKDLRDCCTFCTIDILKIFETKLEDKIYL